MVTRNETSKHDERESAGRAKDRKQRTSVRDRLRVSGRVDLSSIDPRKVLVGPTDKDEARAQIAALEDEVCDLHARLWAEAKGGGTRSLLLVVQGMDTSGKGGVAKVADRLVDPLGFRVVSFGPPTEEERANHYLHRHELALPPAGGITMWDRSHYEEVLVVRVHELVPADVWGARYDEINQWEQALAGRGVTMVKCMLHISADEQRQRLLDRLADPSKHWKYNPKDVDERAKWPDYQTAYDDALSRCSTDVAPWYVIPADRKWHRDWLIAQLLVETLRDMAPAYPSADFDVVVETARVRAS
jgi:PPK2 family polyphosphate:nucleotide phosphotransferase